MSKRFGEFDPTKPLSVANPSPAATDKFSRELEIAVRHEPRRVEDLTPDYFAGDPTDARTDIGADVLRAAIDDAVHEEMFPHEKN